MFVFSYCVFYHIFTNLKTFYVKDLLYSTSVLIEMFWFTAPSLQNRRYSSVARIHSMTIEAPITKVLSLHKSFQGNVSFGSPKATGTHKCAAVHSNIQCNALTMLFYEEVT